MKAVLGSWYAPNITPDAEIQCNRARRGGTRNIEPLRGKNAKQCGGRFELQQIAIRFTSLPRLDESITHFSLKRAKRLVKIEPTIRTTD
jgi:hypothetical protein